MARVRGAAMDRPVVANPPDDEHIRKQGEALRQALGRPGVEEKIRESSNSSCCAWAKVNETKQIKEVATEKEKL